MFQAYPDRADPVKIRLKICLGGAANGGLRDGGFKEIRGYLRKKAFFLRYPRFSGGALQPLRKRAKKAEKGRKRPISADFREGRPDTP